jgi:hypothetical protein
MSKKKRKKKTPKKKIESNNFELESTTKKSDSESKVKSTSTYSPQGIEEIYGHGAIYRGHYFSNSLFIWSNIFSNNIKILFPILLLQVHSVFSFMKTGYLSNDWGL